MACSNNRNGLRMINMPASLQDSEFQRGARSPLVRPFLPSCSHIYAILAQEGQCETTAGAKNARRQASAAMLISEKLLRRTFTKRQRRSFVAGSCRDPKRSAEMAIFSGSPGFLHELLKALTPANSAAGHFGRDRTARHAAAAVATLSEGTGPIGAMETSSSHFSRVRRRMPLPSFPSTSIQLRSRARA